MRAELIAELCDTPLLVEIATLPGRLFWCVDIGRKIKYGVEAGSGWPTGYWRIGYKNCGFPRSHLIYYIHKGIIPPEEIDHIDHNRSNDKIENLRLATRRQNTAYRKIPKKDGLPKGVYRAGDLFKAICDGKHLGLFRDPGEAYEVYCFHAREAFGAFAFLEPFDREAWLRKNRKLS